MSVLPELAKPAEHAVMQLHGPVVDRGGACQSVAVGLRCIEQTKSQLIDESISGMRTTGYMRRLA